MEKVCWFPLQSYEIVTAPPLIWVSCMGHACALASSLWPWPPQVFGPRALQAQVGQLLLQSEVKASQGCGVRSRCQACACQSRSLRPILELLTGALFAPPISMLKNKSSHCPSFPELWENPGRCNRDKEDVRSSLPPAQDTSRLLCWPLLPSKGREPHSGLRIKSSSSEGPW